MPQNIKKQIVDTILNCPAQRLELAKLNKLFNFEEGKETLQEMFATGELLMFRDRRKEVIVNDGTITHHKTMHSAGADSIITEDVLIPSGSQVLVPVSFKAKGFLAEDEVAILSPRSSFFNVEKGRELLLTNSIGIIDSDYPDVVMYSYYNVGTNDVELKAGESAGQIMILKPVLNRFPTKMVEREGGFGSTDEQVSESVDTETLDNSEE